jgi:hypothetical protein
MSAAILLAPTLAHAQASIAGIVRDTSNAVLVGVTVEVASPALTENTRTVTTDERGQYRVTDLPSGTYTITFTLPGFATLKRESLELSGTFTATLHAVLRPSTVTRTVTVASARSRDASRVTTAVTHP